MKSSLLFTPCKAGPHGLYRRVDQDLKTRRTGFGYPGQPLHPISVVLSEWWPTADFLQEPQPGFVSHATLSAGFVPSPLHSDAVMFSAENVGPAALHMLSAMLRHCTHRPVRYKTSYGITLETDQTFCRRNLQVGTETQMSVPCIGQCRANTNTIRVHLLELLDDGSKIGTAGYVGTVISQNSH